MPHHDHPIDPDDDVLQTPLPPGRVTLEMMDFKLSHIGRDVRRIDRAVTGGDDPAAGHAFRIATLEAHRNSTTPAPTPPPARKLPWWAHTLVGGVLLAAGTGLYNWIDKLVHLVNSTPTSPTPHP